MLNTSMKCFMPCDGTVKSCQSYPLVVWGTSCSLVSLEHDAVLAMHMAKQSKLLSILSIRFRGTMALPGINSHGTVHTTHEKASHAGPAARNPAFLLSAFSAHSPPFLPNPLQTEG